MKYKIYIDRTLVAMVPSFQEAQDWLEENDPDMLVEEELRPYEYSPITLEEAQMYCDDVSQETWLLYLVNIGYTPEQALQELNLLPRI